MQGIIKDLKVDTLPQKGQPNSRYYITKGIDEVEEYITDKYGNFRKISSNGNTNIYNEIPIGIINGINRIFTTINNFITRTTRVYKNGQRLTLDNDYIESSANQITLLYNMSSGKIIIDYNI